jgi:hypothetical protein
MKQTAVEWLVDQLKDVKYNPLETNGYSNALERLYTQANTMFEEQVEKTFKQAQECSVKADGVYFKYESFEQYYNETYGDESTDAN